MATLLEETDTKQSRTGHPPYGPSLPPDPRHARLRADVAIQARKVVANCYEVVSVARTPWLSQIPHPTLAARSNRCTLCRLFRRNRPASDWKPAKSKPLLGSRRPPAAANPDTFGTAWRAEVVQAIRRNADRENRAARRRNLRSDRSCRHFSAARRPSPEPADTEPAHCPAH